MGGPPYEADAFDQAAVERLEGDFGCPGRHDVDHQAQIDVVEPAALNQFGFAAQKMQHALTDQLFAVGQLDELLGRHCHEMDLAAQSLHNAWCQQAQGGPVEGCDLDVVAAGMDGARFGVGIRMVGADHGIQFADQGNRGAGASRIQGQLDPWDVRADLPAQRQRSESIQHPSGGPGFLESGFRLLVDRIAQAGDRIFSALDGLEKGFWDGQSHTSRSTSSAYKPQD